MISFVKQASSRVAQSEAFGKIIARLERLDGQESGLLRVLTYHRVDEPGARPWLDPSLISATPEAFDAQMEYLVTHYQIVTMSEVVNAFETRNHEELPSRAMVITFDDAYCDFEEHAWPILRRYGIPVTLFVPTAFPDQPEQTFWWDDLYQAVHKTSRKDTLDTPVGSLPLSDISRNHTYRRLKSYLKTLKHVEAISKVKQVCNALGIYPANNSILGWDSLRRLSSEGVVLGAHTRTHPLMNRVTLEEARTEASGSWHDLEREIGSTLPIFAYPSGQFNVDVADLLEHEGFKLAFTTTRGINRIHRTDPMRIRRINVGARTTLPILRAQLLSWMANFTWLQIAGNA